MLYQALPAQSQQGRRHRSSHRSSRHSVRSSRRSSHSSRRSSRHSSERVESASLATLDFMDVITQEIAVLLMQVVQFASYISKR